MKSMRKQILYTSTKKLNGGALAVNYFIPEFPVGNPHIPLVHSFPVFIITRP